MLFTPLHDNLLVKEVQAQEVMQGAIILHNAPKQKIFEVMAVSEEVKKLGLEVGAQISLAPNHGQSMQVEGQSFTIVSYRSVLGVFHGKS